MAISKIEQGFNGNEEGETDSRERDGDTNTIEQETDEIHNALVKEFWASIGVQVNPESLGNKEVTMNDGRRISFKIPANLDQGIVGAIKSKMPNKEMSARDFDKEMSRAILEMYIEWERGQKPEDLEAAINKYEDGLSEKRRKEEEGKPKEIPDLEKTEPDFIL